jgi:hypothetical protein
VAVVAVVAVVSRAALAAAAIPASGAIPTYCKVNGTLAPKLNFEIRLPDAWNGKLHCAGGDGYNGAIPDVTQSLSALKQGYATASSDSGHQAVTAGYGLVPSKSYYEG